MPITTHDDMIRQYLYNYMTMPNKTIDDLIEMMDYIVYIKWECATILQCEMFMELVWNKLLEFGTSKKYPKSSLLMQLDQLFPDREIPQ